MGWKKITTEADLECAAWIYPWGNEPVEDGIAKDNFWHGFFPYENRSKDCLVTSFSKILSC